MNQRPASGDASMPDAPALASALQPLFADDPDALEILRLAVLSAPQPSYGMPESIPDETAPALAAARHIPGATDAPFRRTR